MKNQRLFETIVRKNLDGFEPKTEKDKTYLSIDVYFKLAKMINGVVCYHLFLKPPDYRKIQRRIFINTQKDRYGNYLQQSKERGIL